jgi:hypothetical protein
MAMNRFLVTVGEWRKISDAGQNGTCWIWDTGDGNTTIIVAHTDSVQTHGTPTGDNIPVGDAVGLSVDTGKQIKNDGSVSPVLIANNASDIYYATKLDSDANDVTLISDMV